MSSAPGRRRFSFVVFLWIFFAARSFAIDWGDTYLLGGEDVEFSGEITIGATLPLTGRFEYYGQSALFGAMERVRMINDAGGVNGKRLVVEWRDNRSNAELTVRQVEQLAMDYRVPAVIGPLLSDSTKAIRGLTEKHRFVVISPMSTSNAVVRQGGWIFRATFNNTAQAEGLIRFHMESRGMKSVGILHDPRHDFSRELEKTFARRFEFKGGRVAGSLSILDDAGEKDYETPLLRLAEQKPDFIFAPLYALEAVEMMQALKKLGIGIPVCGSDTWDNELVYEASGRRLAGTVIASPLAEQMFSYRPFQTFFTSMMMTGMEQPDAQAAYAWDAVSMLAEAFKTGETPEELRKGLLKIENMPLATGRLTILPNYESKKPLMIRVIQERANRLSPIFANRYE